LTDSSDYEAYDARSNSTGSVQRACNVFGQGGLDTFSDSARPSSQGTAMEGTNVVVENGVNVACPHRVAGVVRTSTEARVCQ